MLTPISIASDESIEAFVAYCKTVAAGTAPDCESPWHQIYMSPWAFLFIHNSDDDPLECEGCRQVGGSIAWCVSGATFMPLDYDQTPFKDSTSSQQRFLKQMLDLAEGHENDPALGERIKALPCYKQAMECWGDASRQLGWWEVNIFARWSLMRDGARLAYRSTRKRVLPNPPSAPEEEGDKPASIGQAKVMPPGTFG